MEIHIHIFSVYSLLADLADQGVGRAIIVALDYTAEEP